MENQFKFKDEHKEFIEEFFDAIDTACYSLQEKTCCPDFLIDHLLKESIGSWQVPNLEQLEEALNKQNTKGL